MNADVARFVSGVALLRRTPRGDPEKLRRFRDRRVRELVRHAYDNVPYYRRLFDEHGVRPGEIEGVADLPRIPITTRKVLQETPLAERVSRGIDPDKLVTRRTGGSSGRRMIIMRTWLEERLLGLFRVRAQHDVGERITDRRVIVHHPGARVQGDNLALWHLMQRVGLYRKHSLSCKDDPEDALRFLRSYRPHVIGGYSSSIARIATAASEEDRRVIRPRVVTVGAEVLTPLMRRQIEHAFGAPVFDFYGAHEFNLLAWQCRSTGNLHVCDDGMVLEVLSGDRAAEIGEQGEVVGTNLHAFASPFLRYRLGDIVTRGPGPCPCGAPFGTIREVQGRTIDMFHLPDGRVLHPYTISRRLRGHLEWALARQGIQESVDHVRLRFVPARDPSPEELDAIRSILADVLGPEVRTTVELVPDLRPEPNGKFRPWMSRVHSEYDNTHTQS